MSLTHRLAASVRHRLRGLAADGGQVDLIHAVKNELVSEVGGVKAQLHAAEFAHQSLEDQQKLTAGRLELALAELELLRSMSVQSSDRTMSVLEPLLNVLRVNNLDEPTLAEIGKPTADLLNYARSDRSPLREVGLWINHPLVIEWLEGSARVCWVNERIIEQPFVLGALAELPTGSSIVDVGGGESLLSVSLAALGHDVTVIEPAGYPFAHPNLGVVEELLTDFRPERRADAVILLSAIEHFGIGHYRNNGELDDDADLAAVAHIRDEVLAPGGLLVLTTPFGPADRNDLERTYDEVRLKELLSGFDVEQVKVGSRIDDLTWTVTSETLTTPDAPGHVVMVKARRRP